MKKVSLRAKRSNLITLSLVIIFLLCFSITSQAKQKKPIDDAQIKKIVSYFKNVLPATWKITVKQNTVPYGKMGKPKCTFIHLENSAEKYKSKGGSMDPAVFEFWFCPKKWMRIVTEKHATLEPATIKPQKNSMRTQLTAVVEPIMQPGSLPNFLCDCKNYMIFYEACHHPANSQENLPDKVKMHFMK